MNRSIAISGSKAKPAISDDEDDDSSSEKETSKKTNVKMQKSMRDDDDFKRRLKETHIKQSEHKVDAWLYDNVLFGSAAR